MRRLQQLQLADKEKDLVGANKRPRRRSLAVDYSSVITKDDIQMRCGKTAITTSMLQRQIIKLEKKILDLYGKTYYASQVFVTVRRGFVVFVWWFSCD